MALTPENVAAEVMHGDLHPGSAGGSGSLQHLFDTTSEVYLPMVSNVHNQVRGINP